MGKEIRRLTQLYREVCNLQSNEFEQFEEAVGQSDDQILHSFCRQIREERAE